MRKRILLTLLVVIAALLFFYSTRQEGEEMQEAVDLVKVDTSQVSSIVVYPEPGGAVEWMLARESNGWIASLGSISVPAVQAEVETLLRSLSAIKTIKPVTQKPKEWELFGVDEGHGIRIKLYEQGSLTEDFILGHTEKPTDTSQAVAYIRLANQNEVFSTTSVRLASLVSDFNRFRSDLLLSFDSDEILKMEWRMPDSTFTFFREEVVWRTDTAASSFDTIGLNPYLQRISRLQGNAFADGFDQLAAADRLDHLLLFTLEGGEQVMVYGYADTLQEFPFTWNSSLNPGNFFEGDSTGLFRKLVAPLYTLTGAGMMNDSILLKAVGED